ncbi:MAG: hypothetical protein HQ567_29435, partial [Candidatus Nealsonbacteria bacterium]|nr:hypothetical protein [Candidatus Nealsonbacteria bacterium]
IWLQVTVKADNLGLAADDVFFFGNVLAEAGDLATDARVTTADLLLARNNPRDFLTPAAITFPYDFNRDTFVNAIDVLLARGNQTNFLNALKLIDLSGDAEKAQQTPPTDLAWLSELSQATTRLQPRKDDNSSEEAVDLLLTTYWP